MMNDNPVGEEACSDDVDLLAQGYTEGQWGEELDPHEWPELLLEEEGQ